MGGRCICGLRVGVGVGECASKCVRCVCVRVYVCVCVNVYGRRPFYVRPLHLRTAL